MDKPELMLEEIETTKKNSTHVQDGYPGYVEVHKDDFDRLTYLARLGLQAADEYNRGIEAATEIACAHEEVTLSHAPDDMESDQDRASWRRGYEDAAYCIGGAIRALKTEPAKEPDTDPAIPALSAENETPIHRKEEDIEAARRRVENVVANENLKRGRRFLSKERLDNIFLILEEDTIGEADASYPTTSKNVGHQDETEKLVVDLALLRQQLELGQSDSGYLRVLSANGYDQQAQATLRAIITDAFNVIQTLKRERGVLLSALDGSGFPSIIAERNRYKAENERLREALQRARHHVLWQCEENERINSVCRSDADREDLDAIDAALSKGGQ